jgi:hypothetical protein
MTITRSYNISNSNNSGGEAGFAKAEYRGGAGSMIDRLIPEYNAERVCKGWNIIDYYGRTILGGKVVLREAKS